MCLKLGHAKFLPFTLSGTFLNRRLKKGSNKNLRFLIQKTDRISEAVRDTA